MLGGWRIAVVRACVRACVLLRLVSNCVPSVRRFVPRGSTQHGGDQLKSLYSESGVWRGLDDAETGDWLLAGCFLDSLAFSAAFAVAAWPCVCAVSLASWQPGSLWEFEGERMLHAGLHPLHAAFRSHVLPMPITRRLQVLLITNYILKRNRFDVNIYVTINYLCCSNYHGHQIYIDFSFTPLQILLQCTQNRCRWSSSSSGSQDKDSSPVSFHAEDSGLTSLNPIPETSGRTFLAIC